MKEAGIYNANRFFSYLVPILFEDSLRGPLLNNFQIDQFSKFAEDNVHDVIKHKKKFIN